MRSLAANEGGSSLWNITQGLLKEKVTGIAQDERGFLWISTWGGLFRYDGQEFRSFKTHPGDGTMMPYDRLDAVKIDSKGNVWCRSFYHPYCFDVTTSTFIDVTQHLEQATRRSYKVHQIYPMQGGYVWLQAEGDVAIRVSIDNPKESARLYSAANGRLKAGKILSINEDSRGLAWILSEGGITVPGLRVSFPRKRFDYWRETAEGCVFLATKNGELWHLNTRTWKMRRAHLPIKTDKILRLAGDEGELLVATSEALLTCHKGKWQVYRYRGVKGSERGRTPSSVNSLYTPLGLPVIGEQKRLSTNWSARKGERIESVKRLFRDEMGRYWMITNLKGAMLLDGINGSLHSLLPDDEASYENKHDSWFFAVLSSQCTVHSLFPKRPDDQTPKRPNLQSNQAKRRQKTPSYTLLMAKDGGLCYYDSQDGELHHLMKDDGSWYQPQVGRTFVDKEGNVWLYNNGNGNANGNGGLDRVSLRKRWFRQWGMYISPCALFMDSKNRLWVGDTRGKLTVWGREYDLGTVYAIEEMKDGTMWMGTKERGLYRLTPENENGDYKVEQFLHNPKDKYSLSANDVFCMTKDKQGNLWVGTYSGGLNKVVINSSCAPVGAQASKLGAQFTIHNSQSLNSPLGSAACNKQEPSPLNLPLSTLNSKLSTYPPLVGSKRGCQFLNKNNSLTWLPTDERSLNIRSLLCTREGIMCVGTSHGVYAFKNGNANGNGNENFNANGSTKKVYHNERRADDVHSLSNNEIMMMYQDKQGYVYCLTPSAGICRTSAEALLSDSAVFTVYDKENLAPSDAPLSIMGDANDNLWITYPHSIAMLNKERTVFYNWQAPPMTFAEIVRDDKGNLIAAADDDIISWNPQMLKPNEEAPRIAIATLTVEGKNTAYDADTADTIRLASHERDVILQLATLTMKPCEKIKYAYRMEGDSTWIMQGENNRLSFLNLSAGYHTIQVRSTNASGVWCSNFRNITLYVTPTFWETPWALLLYIAIGAIIIGGIALLWAYIYRLHLKMRSQEEIIKQRMEFIHNVAPLIRENKDDLLERVRQYIDSHISDETLTIPSIAAEMGMSRTTFFSRFKELSGLSPQDYLTHYRIAYARQLLQAGGLSVSEVAYKSGFSDPKYFSRIFKKVEGVSPSNVKH